jgi:hypothetical protein
MVSRKHRLSLNARRYTHLLDRVCTVAFVPVGNFAVHGHGSIDTLLAVENLKPADGSIDYALEMLESPVPKSKCFTRYHGGASRHFGITVEAGHHDAGRCGVTQCTLLRYYEYCRL